MIYFLIRDIHFGGGGERVTVNLANWFAEKGYKVTIVSIAVPYRENIFRINQEVKIDYLGIDFKTGINVWNKIKSVYAVKKYFTRKKQYGSRQVVFGTGTYPGLLLSLLPSDVGIKRIGCQHCAYSALNLRWRWLGKKFFHRLDALVSLTERDVPNWKTMNQNTVVIPNAVSFFPEEPALLDNKRILSIGRIDYFKGYDLLLDVFERFAEREKEWQLRIIGEGPLKKKIIRRIKEKGLTQRIEILSPKADIMEEYLNASVYIMTSRTEGFPMVLIEAQACGVPSIAFDCETGPSEIIHHGTDGYLVEEYTVDKMSDYLLELCTDSNKRKIFGKNGRENVRDFSAEKIGERWEELIGRVNGEQ